VGQLLRAGFEGSRCVAGAITIWCVSMCHVVQCLEVKGQGELLELMPGGVEPAQAQVKPQSGMPLSTELCASKVVPGLHQMYADL
jgi:hypothetical protein